MSKNNSNANGNAPSELIIKPFVDFAKLEASGGIVLIGATLVAMVWANSPLAHYYHELWHTTVSFNFGGFELSKHLIHWINDGLMAIFFFVVGLEIKREILVGELSSLRKSALPIAAAIGGMAVPGLLFAIFNMGGEGQHGWGIPMATDIAFALGILALLGNRVPVSLKIFLTALAIIDDIGAVLIIALFYSANISWISLGAAGLITALLFGLNKMDVRHPLVYMIVGFFLWVAFLKSGLHATVAGVLLAFTVPASARIHSKRYVEKGRRLLNKLETIGVSEKLALASEDQLNVIRRMKTNSQHLEAPLQRLEHAYHNWTTYFIIPVFALANAGVELNFEVDFLIHPVTIGVFLGLLVGKQVGVLFFSWLAVRLKLADPPEGVTWMQIYGAGMLAGIGFTMSLFVTNLAFSEPEFIQMAKIGILGASLIAGVAGYVILNKSLPKTPAKELE